MSQRRTDIYFDFEFIDDGREIVPIALGMCTGTCPDEIADGLKTTMADELYLEYQFDPARANDWVREHVFPYLIRNLAGKHNRWQAAKDIDKWVKHVCGGTNPRFWGYVPAYDWVCLAQHFGTLMQRPKGWSIRPQCLKQLADHLGVSRSEFPVQPEDSHNALADAKWNRDLHRVLTERQSTGDTR